jgi:hypothetical protein
VSVGDTTITRATRLEDPRDRPRVAGDLKRDPVARIEALGEQRKRVRPRRDPTRRAHPALGHDRHLAEIAMDVQRYRSHLSLLAIARRTWETGGQTTTTDPRSKRNRASRRGGH